MELSPQSASAHSDLLKMLHFVANVEPSAVFDEHLRWAERHAKPLYAAMRAHANDPSPGRVVRVG